MDVPIHDLMAAPLFSWISQPGMEMLANCFDMEAEKLVPGACRQSRGRIGYILSGTADTERGKLVPGGILGVRLLEDGGFCLEEALLCAREHCTVVWMDPDILSSVCYRACWFHGRFVTEIKQVLAQHQKDC